MTNFVSPVESEVAVDQDNDGYLPTDERESDGILIDESATEEDLQTGDGGPPDQTSLRELIEELRGMRQRVDGIEDQVEDYLIRNPPVVANPSSASFDAICVEKLQGSVDEVLDRMRSLEEPIALLAKKDQSERGGDQSADIVIQKVGAKLTQLAEEIGKAFRKQSATIAEFQNDTQSRMHNLLETLRPPEEEPEPETPDHGEWLERIFGEKLYSNDAIAEDLSRLQSEILEGNGSALSLAGQLLIYFAASPDRKPQLLKDVGEAFYRCRPKSPDGDSQLELAFKDAIQQSVEEVGLPNRIELVRLGERFDSTRHSTSSRGGVITEVHGWVVLRDNGRVYTKAAVSVE